MISTTISDMEKLKPFVTLLDEWMDLRLYCHVDTETGDDEVITASRKVRGMVFDKHDKIVMNCLPVPVELSLDNEPDMNELTTRIEGDGYSNCVFTPSMEGTAIRVYYSDNRWFISTYRKINAFESKWSSNMSFGTLFKNALKHLKDTDPAFEKELSNTQCETVVDQFTATLTEGDQYMFLLPSNTDNRIVCHAIDNPGLYYIGSFKPDGSFANDDYQLIRPVPRVIIKDGTELSSYVRNIDTRQYQGLLIQTSDNVYYKIYNPSYKYYYDIRGNQPSVAFRYLEVRHENEYTTAIRALYPEMTDTFDEYENTLAKIAFNLHKLYIIKYVNKHPIVLPSNEFRVLRLAHHWFVSQPPRGGHHVTNNIIRDIVNEQFPSSLNKMIKTFNISQDPNHYTKKH